MFSLFAILIDEEFCGFVINVFLTCHIFYHKHYHVVVLWSSRVINWARLFMIKRLCKKSIIPIAERTFIFKDGNIFYVEVLLNKLWFAVKHFFGSMVDKRNVLWIGVDTFQVWVAAVYFFVDYLAQRQCQIVRV